MCYDSVYDSTLLIYVHVHVSMPSTEFRVRYLPYTTECDMTGLYLGCFTVQTLTDSQIKSSTRSRKRSLFRNVWLHSSPFNNWLQTCSLASNAFSQSPITRGLRSYDTQFPTPVYHIATAMGRIATLNDVDYT